MTGTNCYYYIINRKSNLVMKLQEVYLKYRKGNTLTDEELKEGIKKFKKLCSLLFEMGESMHMSWKECNGVLMGLEHMRNARKERR